MSQIKGILGEKLGMTQIFEETRAVPVTVIKAGPCFVAQVKTKETDGYDAVQLAFVEPRSGRVTKPMQGHFDANGGQPGRHVVELRTDDASSYTPGQEIRADVFSVGERADVVGVSKGKGFSGPMKRHGFAGLGSSHGTQRKHLSPGSIGACDVQADAERNLLLVKGAVPGPDGGLVMVRSAVKAPAGKGA